MKLNWFIPIALLIPLRLSATDASVGGRAAILRISSARSSLRRPGAHLSEIQN